ncbi:alpha/beta fold hydrolase [Aliterella atlantica]|uniref:Alpha/beta hydrolase n=1 Tax=Aliterella atlantica CENA595 TaxID=1618023 RepID=A0A0D8ZXU0_9CYAN|nr:alpha/beta hydrolase [Aliterella atlantica]KJH73249.1 alpha/beta hydrolase [Aliterella atlantica CENA595]
MLQFQPPGFVQQVTDTSLGSMVYYTPVATLEQKLPTLLFLHNFGGGASAYEWSKVYPAFTHNYRVIAPDLIGWGQSAHPVRNYQISDYLTTIAEFIRQVCTPPVVVVASSLSAALTMRLAISHRELFQALFLVCPSGFDDFGQGAGRRLPLQLINTPFVDRFIYTLGAENEVAVRNFLERFLFANPQRVSPEMVQAYLASAQQPNAIYSALAFLRGDLYFDLSLYIPRLSVPTVMAWGEAAQFTSIKLGQQLAKLNPQAISAVQAIAGAGVLPHLEMPEIVINLLQQYLRKFT